MQNSIQKRRKNLKKVIEYMKAYSSRLNMISVYTVPEQFSTNFVPVVANIKPSVEQDCGSSCCIAGFIVCALGSLDAGVTMDTARELLELDRVVGYALFTPGASSMPELEKLSLQFSPSHTMGNFDINVAIEALQKAVQLQEARDVVEIEVSNV